ncbi:MAG TPA: hypothetical protein VNE41_07085 [Chitinophagaceae bacterium]|nr:hypothetical protein [Chitinophagaceae bacterium]
MADDNSHNEDNERLNFAFKSPLVPKIYMNSFITGFSNTETFLIHIQNGVPQQVFLMPHSAAKSLAESLNKTIMEVENIFGEVKTLNKLNDLRNPKNEPTS